MPTLKLFVDIEKMWKRRTDATQGRSGLETKQGEVENDSRYRRDFTGSSLCRRRAKMAKMALVLLSGFPRLDQEN